MEQKCPICEAPTRAEHLVCCDSCNRSGCSACVYTTASPNGDWTGCEICREAEGKRMRRFLGIGGAEEKGII